MTQSDAGGDRGPRRDPARQVPGLWRALTPRSVALASVLLWAIFAARYVPIHDAITYLAAGERLNAGHLLYALSPGDRIVDTTPAFFTAPLLSPPLVAVLWRPLAALPDPLGVGIWLAIHALAMIALISFAVRSWTACLLVVLISMGVAIELVTGNLTGLLAAGYALVWLKRERPWVGALIAFMAALKLLPVVFVGFLVCRRDVRGLGWFVLGGIACAAIVVVGAGAGSFADYLHVAQSSLPQPWSLPYYLGVPWIAPVLLAAGTIAAALLPERWSYRLCVLTVLVAAPTFGPAYLIVLVDLLVPNADDQRRSARADPPSAATIGNSGIDTSRAE